MVQNNQVLFPSAGRFRLQCEACSDHATGESVGSVVCYDCADGDQTRRWYGAREKGKKHFLFGVTCDSLNNHSGFLVAK
jgi:hypothetical protein